jgi:prepilin-type N-terminal cleavage/methylation domain-containing protein
MSKTRKHIQNDNGFTLVELMVTVFLTAIAVISIYRGYTAFSQAADAQQQVMEMQQNLRIGMTRLAADIRRAGMNEDGEDVASFMCDEVPTNDTSIEFSMDLGSGGVFASDTPIDNDDDGEIDEEDESRIGDGDTLDDDERIHYLYDEDFNNNGVLDAGEDVNENGVLDQDLLQRGVWDFAKDDYIWHTLITNVEALDFVYFDDTGAELVPSAPTVSECPYVALPGFAGELSLKGDELQEVDRVEITLVVRATNEDLRYNDNVIYSNLQGTPLISNKADHFRRRVFSMSVQIRNNI